MLASVHAKGDQKAAAKDAYQNRGNVPFFLQDPLDGECLGPNGFTACDTTSLWILAGRKEGHSLVALLEPEEGKSCLGTGSGNSVKASKCSTKQAKHWKIDADRHGYYVISTDQAKMCLFRSKDPYKSSVKLQPCKSGYTPLQVVETAIHDVGFFLESADGMCFDGIRFRHCNAQDESLLWGIGVRFGSKGDAMRSFFKYFDGSKCLSKTSKGPVLGPCTDAPARKWGLKDGKLVHENKMCVVRKKDNTAALVKCDTAFEHISLAIPENSINQRDAYMQEQHKVQLQEELLERMRLQQQLEQLQQDQKWWG